MTYSLVLCIPLIAASENYLPLTMHLTSGHATALSITVSHRERWLWWASAFFGLAILVGNPNYHWSEDRQSPFGADFVQEWVAGDMLLSGAAERIYDRDAFQTWQHDSERLGFAWPESQYYPAVYPPPYYCLTAPLALLPYRVAAVAWLALLVLAYAAAAHLCLPHSRETSGEPVGSAARVRHTWLWCIGLLLPAMFFGCVLGQKGSLWLLTISGTVYLIKHQRPWAAGCIAALLTLKPTLCLLLPVAMLLAGQWRFFGGFLMGSLLIYGSSVLCLPISMWTDYLQVVRGAAEYQSHAGYRSGWSTSAMTLLGVVGTPPLVCAMILACGAVAVWASGLISSRRAGVGSPLAQPDWQWHILAGTALLSPHAYFYDLTWLMVPVSGWMQTDIRRALSNLAILWVGMVLGQMFENGPAFPAIALLLVGLRSLYVNTGSPLTLRQWEQ